MQTALTIGVMLSIVVSIVAIYDIVKAHDDDVRAVRKNLWYVLALVPFIGAIGWFTMGRPERGPSGKRVAKDRSRRGKRHKISADRQVVVDRLTSDVRMRESRPYGSAGSPGSPGSLAYRAARSAESPGERFATSPASATNSQDN